MRILILLLVSLSLEVQAQIVDFSKFATKEDLVNAIKEAQFGNVKPPVIKLPGCKAGPELISVYGVTQSSLSFEFYGEEVYEIEYGIITGSDTLKGVVSPTSARPTVSGFNIAPGGYKLAIRGKSCSSAWSVKGFTVSGSTGDREFPTPTEKPNTLGAYELKVGNTEYSYSKSPKLSLSLSDGGVITDVSPGIVHGNISKFGDKNAFYMISYGHLSANGTYKTLKDIKLPDGVYTIRRFDSDPQKIDSYEKFKANLHGYPQEDGVNRYTTQVSEVNLTIRTTSNPGIPALLKISRGLNFVGNVPDRAFGKKLFAVESINYLDKPEAYHAKGVHTSNNFNGPAPNSYRTYKFPRDMTPGSPKFTDDELYNFLRGHINQWGLTPNSVITDEVPENTQGQDNSIYERSALMYKGALELFQEKFPGTKKRDTNLFGPYGLDDYLGYVGKDNIRDKSRAEIVEWVRSHDSFYFKTDHYKYRNVNVGYYMYNNVRMIPYELILTNERVKVSTKTMPGGDWESDWAVFGTTLCQSLVLGKDNAPAGVEENHSGEIIPFKNGEILRFPSQNSMIGEHYELGFWSTLLGRGIMLWGAGSFGSDKDKISYYTDPTWGGWPIRFRKNGEENWGSYAPGVNGAPLNESVGIRDNLYATVIDVTMAGRQDALKLVDGYADNIYFGSYTSSKKIFTAVPGDAGYNLNGFGPLNLNFAAFKDAYDQKCAVSLITSGTKGKAVVYYNGFLSADEYEDNVTLTFGSITKNLGRVYGRKTVWVKF